MHPVIGGDVLRHCESQINRGIHSVFRLGIEVLLATRIVALADVFDALTSKRLYKEARPVNKILNLLEKKSGKYLNPVIIQAFRCYKLNDDDL